MGEGPVIGAVKFHEISKATEQITYAEFLALWNDPAHPMVAMSTDDFAEAKIEIEDACSYLKNCTEPAIINALSFLKRVEMASKKIKLIRAKEINQ